MKLTTFSRHHIISRLWLPSTNGTVFCPWNLASYEEEKPFLQELLSQANTPKRFPWRKPGGNNPELVWLHRFKGSFYESYFNNRKATERHIWHYKRIAPWIWGTSVGSDMTLAGASPSLLCWANAASPASPQKITWADSTAEWTQAHTCAQHGTTCFKAVMQQLTINNMWKSGTPALLQDVLLKQHELLSHSRRCCACSKQYGVPRRAAGAAGNPLTSAKHRLVPCPAWVMGSSHCPGLT